MGLSDTLQSFFFSPKKPGPFGLIWGLGPVLLYPTGTHPLLGTGTFSIGPTLVVLEQTGPWTIGALMNQLWSVVTEEHRSSYSAMFIQPFISYTTKSHTTFTIDTESTADWNASSDDGKWTVPVIFQISQILKIGTQPVSIQIGGKYTPTHRATAPTGACGLISHCFTPQAGIPRQLRGPVCQNNDQLCSTPSRFVPTNKSKLKGTKRMDSGMVSDRESLSR